ncbi:hypothetical protein RQP46_001167 [Phenoliferia psychrophenolica]
MLLEDIDDGLVEELTRYLFEPKSCSLRREIRKSISRSLVVSFPLAPLDPLTPVPTSPGAKRTLALFRQSILAAGLVSGSAYELHTGPVQTTWTGLPHELVCTVALEWRRGEYSRLPGWMSDGFERIYQSGGRQARLVFQRQEIERNTGEGRGATAHNAHEDDYSLVRIDYLMPDLPPKLSTLLEVSSASTFIPLLIKHAIIPTYRTLRWLGLASATGSFGHTSAPTKSPPTSTNAQTSQDSGSESDTSIVTVIASDVIGRNVRAEPDSLVAGLLDRGREVAESLEAFSDTAFGRPITELCGIFLVLLGQRDPAVQNEREMQAKLREAMGEENYRRSQQTLFSRSTQRQQSTRSKTSRLSPSTILEESEPEPSLDDDDQTARDSGADQTQPSSSSHPASSIHDSSLPNIYAPSPMGTLTTASPSKTSRPSARSLFATDSEVLTMGEKKEQSSNKSPSKLRHPASLEGLGARPSPPSPSLPPRPSSPSSPVARASSPRPAHVTHRRTSSQQSQESVIEEESSDATTTRAPDSSAELSPAKVGADSDDGESEVSIYQDPETRSPSPPEETDLPALDPSSNVGNSSPPLVSVDTARSRKSAESTSNQGPRTPQDVQSSQALGPRPMAHSASKNPPSRPTSSPMMRHPSTFTPSGSNYSSGSSGSSVGVGPQQSANQTWQQQPWIPVQAGVGGVGFHGSQQAFHQPQGYQQQQSPFPSTPRPHGGTHQQHGGYGNHPNVGFARPAPGLPTYGTGAQGNFYPPTPGFGSRTSPPRGGGSHYAGSPRGSPVSSRSGGSPQSVGRGGGSQRGSPTRGGYQGPSPSLQGVNSSEAMMGGGGGGGSPTASASTTSLGAGAGDAGQQQGASTSPTAKGSKKSKRKAKKGGGGGGGGGGGAQTQAQAPQASGGGAGVE